MGTLHKRWWLNLLLLAVVAALAAFAILRSPLDGVEAEAPLTTLATGEVARVRIEHPKRGVTVLEKTARGWMMTQPVRERASPVNMAHLLLLASARSEFQTPADTDTLARYGLERSDTRVFLNDEEILVGSQHPLDAAYYVRVRDTVHLLPAHVLAAVFLEPMQLVDARLLEEGSKLTALRLPKLSLVRDDGAWRPASGTTELSTDRLNSFASDWEYARALWIERRSNKRALAQIEMTTELDTNAETHVFDVLSYEPGFVLARRGSGIEYHLPGDTGKRLLTLELPAAP